ncbi:conserved hypothetical protein [Streptomyces himastatinicus ATCC 53653]|uniref:Uncharacterized protein n=1 Tax=Streptomyces himastatinicus ATCC 53653 TaxID=457427 RepID=D9WBR2_9ACTN|nr:hypothetical protein [Streptomyces himastatinicus]EFL25018.1 conserved hypothetical protein [Streptomyces himastatinicus ATCC 53653]
MGVDITVLVVDWEHLMEIAPDDRLEVLQESAYADDDSDLDIDAGWVWPAEPDRSWLGRYEFGGTLGSYKPHFWAAHAWDYVRGGAERELRVALDGFLSALIWWGPEVDTDAEHVDAGVFPSGARLWRSGPLIARGPQTVAHLNRYWQAAAPVLPQLREPYARHAASPGGWAADFEDFTALLSGWAETVGEAERRRWGLIGLPL